MVLPKGGATVHNTLALKRLQNALLREHNHFQNVGATETTIKVVVDQRPPTTSAEISDVEMANSHGLARGKEAKE